LKHTCSALITVVLAGCQAFQREQREHLHHGQESESFSGTVDVGGFVNAAKALEIPPSGLSLLQAITRAGGVRVGGSAADAAFLEGRIWFVTLQRPGRIGQQTFLIPLDLVQQEIAGNIALQHRDVVQVLPYESTSLSMSESAEEVSVTVAGLVPRPGRYRVQGELASLTNDDSAGGNPIEAGATIVLVSRSAMSGLAMEHYLIPLGGVGADPSFWQAKIQGEDVYTFTRLERVPIVLAGILDNVRRDAVLQATHRRGPLQQAAHRNLQPASQVPGLRTLPELGRGITSLR
jgi:hypothetical protein